MSKKPLDPCAICNRARKSNRYPTCCSDCPETAGAKHSKKCDYFQLFAEHLPGDRNMTFKIELPGYSDIFITGTMQRLGEIAKHLDLQWVSRKKVQLTDCVFEMTDDTVTVIFPIRFVVPDLLDFGEVTYEAADLNWQVCLEYPRLNPQTHLNVTTKNKAKAIVAERVTELFTLANRKNKGQVVKDSECTEELGELIQMALRYPVYVIKEDGSFMYEKKGQVMDEFSSDEKGVVGEFLKKVYENMHTHPKVAMAIIESVAGRFRVPIDEGAMDALHEAVKLEMEYQKEVRRQEEEAEEGYVVTGASSSSSTDGKEKKKKLVKRFT